MAKVQSVCYINLSLHVKVSKLPKVVEEEEEEEEEEKEKEEEEEAEDNGLFPP